MKELEERDEYIIQMNPTLNMNGWNLKKSIDLWQTLNTVFSNKYWECRIKLEEFSVLKYFKNKQQQGV